MEALLEREGDVDSWNDERLDELSRRMDAGFARTATKEEMNLRFGEVNRRFGEVNRRFGEVRENLSEINSHLSAINDRLDRMNHTLMLGAFGLIAALIANGIWG
jgi:uncharacterized coiled-coil DUF342 family protein